MQCCREKLGGQFCNTCDHRHKRHRHRHNQILNQRLETYNVLKQYINADITLLNIYLILNRRLHFYLILGHSAFLLMYQWNSKYRLFEVYGQFCVG